MSRRPNSLSPAHPKTSPIRSQKKGTKLSPSKQSRSGSPVVDLRTQLIDMAGNMAAIKEENASLRRELSLREKKILDLSQLREMDGISIGQLERAIDEIRIQCDSEVGESHWRLKEIIKGLKKDIRGHARQWNQEQGQMKGESDKKERKIQKLKEAGAVLEARIIELEKKKSALQNENAKLGNEITSLQWSKKKEISDMTTLLKSQEENRHDLQEGRLKEERRNNELTKEVKLLNLQISQMEHRNKMLAEEKEEAVNSLETIRGEIEKEREIGLSEREQKLYFEQECTKLTDEMKRKDSGIREMRQKSLMEVQEFKLKTKKELEDLHLEIRDKELLEIDLARRIAELKVTAEETESWLQRERAGKEELQMRLIAQEKENQTAIQRLEKDLEKAKATVEEKERYLQSLHGLMAQEDQSFKKLAETMDHIKTPKKDQKAQPSPSNQKKPIQPALPVHMGQRQRSQSLDFDFGQTTSITNSPTSKRARRRQQKRERIRQERERQESEFNNDSGFEAMSGGSSIMRHRKGSPLPMDLNGGQQQQQQPQQTKEDFEDSSLKIA